MARTVTKEQIENDFDDILVGFFGHGCEFACWSGWNEIIYDALHDISIADPQAGIIQIKEKFAGLDIHTDSQEPEVWEICNKARVKSLTTCESCGKMEETKGDFAASKGFWIKTICPECLKDW